LLLRCCLGHVTFTHVYEVLVEGSYGLLGISPMRGMYFDRPCYLHNQSSKWQGSVGHNLMDVPHRPNGMGGEVDRGYRSSACRKYALSSAIGSMLKAGQMHETM
jgi:hypothetical protein